MHLQAVGKSHDPLCAQLSLLAMTAWNRWLPELDWLARMRTVVAGAALQSIKFDAEAKEIVACPRIEISTRRAFIM